MKDFISKVTFGFFMAQLFPGAIVVFAITCITKTGTVEQPQTLYQILTKVGDFWFNSTVTSITFFFLAVALGMLIHGLNWTTLAWLENRSVNKGYDSPREFFWHKLPFLVQLFISPLAMILEVLWILIAPGLDCLTMDENVAKIKQGNINQFLYLQEFYLHFGQFYAHVAYAFLVATVCTLICYIYNSTYSLLLTLVLIYFLTSLFFLLGRIQLGSLFKAERTLTEQSTPTEAGK